MINNFDREDFLQNYWQKKPLFIKNAFKDFKSPLSIDELASLTLEEEAISRLIVCNEEVKNPEDYKIEEGPFTEEKLSSLKDGNWNLLIQEVDHWSDEILKMRGAFSFIPHWRFDDVMASMGGKNGHVGAHLDWYDVFILQAEGKKVWKLEDKARSFEQFEGDHLVKDLDVKILSDFRPSLEFVLEPGDLLYIPIGHAHQGLNCEKTLSYSFGLRAPTLRDMILEHLKEELSSIHEDERMLDDTNCWERPGQIPTQIISSLLKSWPSNLNLPTEPHLWFGKLVTTPMRYEVSSPEDISNADLLNNLEQGRLFKNPHGRLAYFLGENTIALFANGERMVLDKSAITIKLMDILCDQLDFSSEELNSFNSIEGFNLILRFLYLQQAVIIDSV